jgi:hypothetical protein
MKRRRFLGVVAGSALMALSAETFADGDVALLTVPMTNKKIGGQQMLVRLQRMTEKQIEIWKDMFGNDPKWFVRRVDGKPLMVDDDGHEHFSSPIAEKHLRRVSR